MTIKMELSDPVSCIIKKYWLNLQRIANKCQRNSGYTAFAIEMAKIIIIQFNNIVSL